MCLLTIINIYNLIQFITLITFNIKIFLKNLQPKYH